MLRAHAVYDPSTTPLDEEAVRAFRALVRAHGGTTKLGRLIPTRARWTRKLSGLRALTESDVRAACEVLGVPFDDYVRSIPDPHKNS